MTVPGAPQPTTGLPAIPEAEALSKRKAPAPPAPLNHLVFTPASAVEYVAAQVPWRMKLRKEAFSPSEVLESPVAIDMIFKQVAECDCSLCCAHCRCRSCRTS